MRRALAWVAASMVACTEIADFPADKLTEQTDALCTNGVDDDEDGLTDCQDWKCLDREACCTIPSVVLEDAFEAPACAANACVLEDRECAPDLDHWERWGAPFPYVCEGALAIGKDFAGCYPVGVLSRATVGLQAGVRIEARVSGVPETAGRLDLGLTLQGAVIDSVEPCSERSPIDQIASIVMAAAEAGGVRFLAVEAGVAIGEIVLAPDAHRVELAITDERTLQFVVDDVEIARTRDPLPPELSVGAHVVVSGIGSAARLEHVRVVTGSQCAAPTSWVPAANPTPLDPAPDGAWDDFHRSSPNALLDRDDRLHLSYAGCRSAESTRCNPLSIAIGEATAAAGTPITREGDERIVTSDVLMPGSTNLTVLDANIVDGHTAYYGVDDTDVGLEDEGELVLRRCDLDFTEEPLIDSIYDDELACCPSVVDRPDDPVRRIYFAAHAPGETAWHIGLLTETNGVFNPAGAVLEPGEEDAFDELGVSQPWVIWDDAQGLFRMWYTATGEPGWTSIGYAVSTDGLTWHKFGQVIDPALLDLVSIGSPTVIDDGGRLRMWVDGQAPGAVAKTIYELENVGVAPP